MAVGIVFFTFLAFYICAVPIKIALHLQIGGKAKFAAGISAFESKLADRMALRHMHRDKKPSHPLRSLHSLRQISACLAAVRYLCAHLKIEAFRATGVIATSDAAHTALLSGFANALSGAFIQNPHIHIRLRSDFSADHADVRLCGMISIRIGHIIGAAITGVAHYIKGGFASWKSTRSKAS